MHTQFTRWAPVVIWMGVIFGFSSLSTVPSTQEIWWDFLIKKSAHVIEYAVLGVLLLRAVSWQRRITQRDYVLTLVICVMYAISDEWHQSFTPGRQPSLRDIGVDTIGVLLSIFYWKRWQVNPKN